MAYVFYFMGFVLMYAISENFAKENYTEQIPEWFHLAAAAIWPLVVMLFMLSQLKDMIMGVPDEE